MKTALLLVLLLSTVIAASALEKSDLTVVPESNPLYLETGENGISVIVSVNPQRTEAVYGVSLKFVPISGISSSETEKTLPEAVTADYEGITGWTITAIQAGTYDLSGAFEVVSWDDSVSLEMDELPGVSGEKVVTISGWTDAAKYCEEHNYSGFWGERENCQVKITAGDEEYWAERSGVFSFEHELSKGGNRLDLRAMDPGGNTNEAVVMIEYVPTIMDTLKEQIIPVVIVLVVFIAGIIGFFVLWKGKREAKGIAKEVTERALAEFSLDELHERQRKLFQEHIMKSQQRGGYYDVTGKQLLYIFDLITQKDPYYQQQFPDSALAIKEHEGIFKDEKVPAVIRKILLEQYSKQLDQQQNQVPV